MQQYLLLTHPAHTSLHLLVPNSQSFPPPRPSPVAGSSLFSASVSLFLLWRYGGKILLRWLRGLHSQLLGQTSVCRVSGSPGGAAGAQGLELPNLTTPVPPAFSSWPRSRFKLPASFSLVKRTPSPPAWGPSEWQYRADAGAMGLFGDGEAGATKPATSLLACRTEYFSPGLPLLRTHSRFFSSPLNCT